MLSLKVWSHIFNPFGKLIWFISVSLSNKKKWVYVIHEKNELVGSQWRWRSKVSMNKVCTLHRTTQRCLPSTPLTTAILTVITSGPHLATVLRHFSLRISLGIKHFIYIAFSCGWARDHTQLWHHSREAPLHLSPCGQHRNKIYGLIFANLGLLPLCYTLLTF